jgi:hypothetical protein
MRSIRIENLINSFQANLGTILTISGIVVAAAAALIGEGVSIKFGVAILLGGIAILTEAAIWAIAQRRL